MTLLVPSPNTSVPDAPKRPRRSWAPAEQAAYVADFAASGLSATAFCRRLGIRRATLARWRQRAAAPPHRARPAPPQGAAGSGFAAVTIVLEVPQAAVPAVVPSAPMASPLTLRLRAATGGEAECAGLDVTAAAALLRAVFTPATAGTA